MKRISRFRIAAAVMMLLASSVASSQLIDEEAIKAWGTPIGEDAIAKLVSDRSWHIDWAACMGGSDGCKTYWDFASDGTVCARGIDATSDSKCADEGKWRIEKTSLCWELTWMGGGSGYKSTCILIKKTAGGGYEATRSKGLGITFFRFSLASN
jgi:hypothetical protein